MTNSLNQQENKNMISDIHTLFAVHDEPWGTIEFPTSSKNLRESGRYYGVEDKNERRIIGYISLATAKLIATAPEMAAFIARIAKDDQSEYQYEA